VSVYYTDVDQTVRNSSQTIELELAGHDKDVLDVGCASGYLGRALAAQGCRVSGVEYDPVAGEAARKHLDRVVVGDVQALDLVAEFGEGSFDVVIFGDVLEHLTDPEGVLRAALPLLRPGGAVIVSVPNVAHGSLRLALLQGRWTYTETGLLDETHVRFFTRDRVRRLVEQAGLQVTDLLGTVLDPLGCEVQVDAPTLPGGIVQWVREQPDAMVYQFVFRAVVGDPSQPWPRLVPAVAPPVVDDEYRRRALDPETPEDVAAERDGLLAEVVELRRRVLNQRDHITGISAELGRERAEHAATVGRLSEAQASARTVTERAGTALHEIGEIKASTSWKVGNALVRPVAGVRRLLGRR
jgi:2-polyprenyl-3-methyl-5-hydroxy-6-metoxy-1,4-benzoquinol methylase